MNLTGRLIICLLIASLSFFSLNAVDAFGDTIVDNGDPGTSSDGTWLTSYGANYYGSRSEYSNEADATYTFEADLNGTYNVNIWWTYYNNRCTSVPVEIYDGENLLDTAYVNQLTDAGQWNLLGTYDFSGTARVVIISEGGCTTNADAVQFLPASNGIVIDNGSAGTSSDGTWLTSYGDNYYGSRSEYSNEDDATYTFEADLNGTHQVSLWWTYYNNRCTSVPVEIYNGENLLDTVYVNQLTDTGQWNVLGTYDFTGTARVVILSEGDCTTNADAVQFILGTAPELAHIEIEGPSSVNENSGVQYNCRAYYTNGTDRLVNPDSCSVDSPYAEISSIGLLTTYEVGGNEPCPITFTYKEGDITRSDTYNITIEDSVPPSDVIIDNGDAGTSSTGTWLTSYGANYFGSRSEYSNEANATYTFEADLNGTYNINIWWTYYNNRCTSVPVEIYDGENLLDTAYVNQLTDVGQWNLLGTYDFSGTARVVIISEGGCTTNADAVEFVLGTAPELAHIEIEGPSSVNENSGAQYNCRAYYTNGTDRLVNADSCSVDSPYAEISSTGLLTTYEVNGDETCQITLTYMEGDITRSDTYNITIEDSVPPSEVTIDNGGAGTSSTGTWLTSYGDNYYGSRSEYSNEANATYTFEADLNGTYQVSLWWTYYSNRCTDVPVQIYNGTNLLSTVYVNQLTNAGHWNVLGTYDFSGTARVVILSEGGCTTNADAVRILSSDVPPAETVEHIYAFFAYYSHRTPRDLTVSMLQNIGAEDLGDVWFYRDESRNKTYYIEIIDGLEGYEKYKAALRTENAHIIYDGHANYGSGHVFATRSEEAEQAISDIEYIDDDRLMNFSSKYFSLSYESYKNSHAFPNWEPIFQDGTSGLMPYTLYDPDFPGDPDHYGVPAFNYYITYQVPGDPYVYRVVSAHNGPIERFPKCGRPAWYSPTGERPDPTNPDHQKYFITNTEPWEGSEPKPHYSGKIILFRKDLEVPQEEFKYSRMFMRICNAGNYYIDTYNRGIMFYSLDNAEKSQPASVYLRDYLLGRSDEEIFQAIQAIEPVFDYYNFNEPPP